MNKRHLFGGGFELGISIALGFVIVGSLILYVVKVDQVQPSSRQVTEKKDDGNARADGAAAGLRQLTETMVDDKARADENAAAGQVGSFTQGLDSYHTDVKEYPHTLKPLSASAITGWHGPYTKGFAKDPWGHDWRYAAPGKHNPDSYDVWSVGLDGVDGTADDIGNWESNGK